MRRYEKPAIIYREKIEARAASCTTAATPKGTNGPCTAPLLS
jgi:hypothetical protein